MTKKEAIYYRFKKENYLGFQEIPVKMGRLHNIGYCADNARQALETGDVETIAEVVYITPKNTVIYHFVEKQDDGTYIDNTLGYLAKTQKYFLIRELTLEDLKNTQMLAYLRERQKFFLGRLFTTEEMDLIDFQPNDL